MILELEGLGFQFNVGTKSLKCGWEDEMLLLCTEEKLKVWIVCCRMAAFAD